VSTEVDPFVVSSLMPALAHHAKLTTDEVREAARAEMDEYEDEEGLAEFEAEETRQAQQSASAPRDGGGSSGSGTSSSAHQIHRPYDRPWAHDMSQHLRPDQRARRHQRQLPAPPPFKVGGHVEVFSDALHDDGRRSPGTTARRRKRDANPKAQKRTAAARASVFQRLSDPARYDARVALGSCLANACVARTIRVRYSHAHERTHMRTRSHVPTPHRVALFYLCARTVNTAHACPLHQPHLPSIRAGVGLTL
jgi:hypothetical protein